MRNHTGSLFRPPPGKKTDPEPEPKPNGHGGKSKKKVKFNESALLKLLMADEAIAGIVARNDLSAYDLMMHPVPTAEDDRDYPRPWEETDTLSLLVYLQDKISPEISDSLLGRTLKILAVANSFNPLQQRLQAVEWDKKPRVDMFLTKALGLDQSDIPRSRYYRAVSRAFIWAIVSRAMRPGCKFDAMLILEGGQGIGKSRFCAALAFNESAWFTDSLPPLTHPNAAKDAREMAMGKMVIEMAELMQFKGTKVEVLKSFLSCPIDTVRLPYLARSGAYKRSCVIIGTTNEDEYLTDVTGNRRFWPVSCGTIDLSYVEANLEQVYAEALDAWREAKGNLRIWLPDDIETIAKKEQEKRREHDEEEPDLVEWINEQFYEGVQFIVVRPMEYLRKAKGWETSTTDPNTMKLLVRIGKLMKALGGTYCGDRKGSKYTFRGPIDDD